jgi:hypothetical protein
MKNKFPEIFCGSSLGLLVGVIIGLSVSQVVGLILGGLVSLLAGFFGLKNNENEGLQTANNNSPRFILIGFFSFMCIAGIFVGIYFRTSNYLAPSIKDKISELTDAGFDSAYAKVLIAKQEFGLLPSNVLSQDINSSEINLLSSGVLMSSNSHQKLDLCYTDQYLNIEEYKLAFSQSSDELDKLIKIMDKKFPSDTTAQRKILDAFKALLCD